MKKSIGFFVFASVLFLGLNVATSWGHSPGAVTGRIGGAHLEYDWLIIFPTNFQFNIFDTIEVKVVEDLKNPRFELYRFERPERLIIYVGSEDLEDKWLYLIESQRSRKNHHNYDEVIPRVIRR